MKSLLAISFLLSVFGAGLSSAKAPCDYSELLRQLQNNEISLVHYTMVYHQCITGQGQGQDTNQNGFQPSCSTDVPVAQAIVKFDNSGEFPAADGSSYPFRVRGVVTLTQINEETARIHATVSGLHSFLFDSDQFSLHVHQKGEITPSCSATGSHYNPCGKNHSDDPSVEDRHVGDVAKVTISSDVTTEHDVLTITAIDTQVKLTGSLSVLGRAITVHAGSDATRVGCGTIAVTEWEGEDHPDSTYDITNPFWA